MSTHRICKACRDELDDFGVMPHHCSECDRLNAVRTERSERRERRSEREAVTVATRPLERARW